MLSIYQSYVQKSRYARFLPSLNRREHLHETVQRYVECICHEIEDEYGLELTDLRAELKEAICSLSVMPSMRAMMTAGKALIRDNTCGYNCFHGEETFITGEGIKSFIDMVGETVTVWTKEGWKPASVKSFGVQPLQQVTLRPTKSHSNIREMIKVTLNHRWITKNRGEVIDLQEGDVIESSVVPKGEFRLEAFIRGFGFGNGTIDSRGKAKIRLCGEKDKKWKGLFETYGHASIWEPESMNGDVMISFHKGYFSDWKKLPFEYVNDSDWLASWLDGYLAADGHDNPNQPGFSSQNEEAIRFVEFIAPLCGYVVTGKNVSQIMETNYGERKSPLIRITLRNSCDWYVTAIETLDEDEVFCVVEPETKSFTLSAGILTGNCSYLPVDDMKAFDEALFILMCGSGVGFSVERQYVNKLPEVPEQLFDSGPIIVVKDSKEGWAKALRMLIALLYSGEIAKWDGSKVRPAGTPLKTFGGRASGFGPLEDLFNFIIRIFRQAKGRKLTSIECHDIMCKIGEVVVVGGVRRAALISLSNLSDDRMRQAKTGQWWELFPQRAMSNNSAVYTEKPDVGAFMTEWLAIYESKSGERGIFSRAAAKKVAARNGRRDPNWDFGVNPSLRKGTKVWTDKGVFPIEELEGKSFEVRNLDGELSEATCWLSGKNKKLWKIILSGGHSYYATAEHKWPIIYNNKIMKVSTDELIEGTYLPLIKSEKLTNGIDGNYNDGFVIGWNLGDGWITEREYGQQIGFIIPENEKYLRNIIQEYLEEKCNFKGDFISKSEINVNNESLRKIFNHFGVKHKRNGLPNCVWDSASEDFRKGLIDGLFSSDGCLEKNGKQRICFTTCHEKLAKDVSELLGFYGIKTTIWHTQKNGYSNGKKYYEKDIEIYSVRINNSDSILHFKELFSLSHKAKNDILNSYETKKEHTKDKIKIVSVEETDIKEDVWDIKVNDETHCFQLAHCITGNCSEIILRPNGFCNLSEVVVRADDSLETLSRKVKLAAIIGTLQSTLTHFPYLRREWQRNAEDERLLGVSLTGIYDCPILNDYHCGTLSTDLEQLKHVVVETNKEWAHKLGINQAAATTCVKPSGTVSSLVDCASGIHPRHARYYLRRARGDNKDPITKFMIEAGVPAEPDVSKPDYTTVFTFPMKAPEAALTRDDISAIDHLELWRLYAKHYCEHKPSVTISIKDDEWPRVGGWVYDHFDEISGVSFLPYDGGTYRQAPFETVNREKYEEILEKMPETIDWDELIEKTDLVEGTQQLACGSAGGCDI